jgi:hypothetical protein
MGCPGWLGLNEDRTGFVFFPDRAEIVRKIFELSIAGLGGYTIANKLNAQNLPAFGPSKKWDQSTIHNMLRSRATIGEYQPRRYASSADRADSYRDRKGIPAGDVIRDYYPAVIEEDLFDRAQEARRENLALGRGRKGRLITNLFAGIPRCAYCAGPVKFHSNGTAKSLICATVLGQLGCYRMAWSYQNFENSFFNFVRDLTLEHTIDQSLADKLAELKALVGSASGPNVYDVRLSIALALKAIVSELKIAAAGAAPVESKPHARIRRDGSTRFFEVTFCGGSTHTVFPASK